MGGWAPQGGGLSPSVAPTQGPALRPAPGLHGRAWPLPPGRGPSAGRVSHADPDRPSLMLRPVFTARVQLAGGKIWTRARRCFGSRQENPFGLHGGDFTRATSGGSEFRGPSRQVGERVLLSVADAPDGARRTGGVFLNKRVLTPAMSCRGHFREPRESQGSR